MNKSYFAIQWHITDVCDQRCQHCYIFSEGHSCLISMSYEELMLTLNQIEDLCQKINRTPYIYLTGGDPILHPLFWTLLEEFHKRQIRFCIMGNPFHLTDETCKRMHELGCVKYQLSLDGLEKTHDRFRKEGSFKTTIEKIKIIKNSGMWCAIMTTVSKVNYNEIPDLIDLVASLNVDVYAFGRYCPTSIEKAYDTKNHLTPFEYKDFLEKCWKKYEFHKDSKTTFQLKDHLWTLFLYEKGYFKPDKNLNSNTVMEGCNCGRNHITILPNGDIYACRRMKSKIGNIKVDKLYDVFTGTNMDNYRKYDKFIKCNQCELKAFCRGCPAVTYGYTHNMYEVDPQCWKEIK